MEFERPAIFKNNNFLETSENKTEEKSGLDLKSILPVHTNIINSFNNLELPLTAPSTSSDSLDYLSAHKDKPLLRYVGVKNIKLINIISSSIINTFYSINFRTKREKIFIKLEEILKYLETDVVYINCYIVYREEILRIVYKRIDSKFVDYIFKMIDINLDEYTRFCKEKL